MLTRLILQFLKASGKPLKILAFTMSALFPGQSFTHFLYLDTHLPVTRSCESHGLADFSSFNPLAFELLISKNLMGETNGVQNEARGRDLKRSVRKLISVPTGIAFEYSGLASLTRFAHREKVVILCYHRVCSTIDESSCFHMSGSITSSKQFRKQMRYVAEHYHNVSLREVLDWQAGRIKLPPNPCVLTFDDGFADFSEEALPILMEFGLKATVFPIGRPLAYREPPWIHAMYHAIDQIGPARAFNALSEKAGDSLRLSRFGKEELREWVKNCLKVEGRAFRRQILHHLHCSCGLESNRSGKLDYMLPDQISWLHNAGFEIGGHSMEHEFLSGLSTLELQEEIRASTRILTRVIGSQPLIFSYPFGDEGYRNNGLVDVLRDNGYKGACTTIQGLNSKDTPAFRLRRIDVGFPMPFPEFVSRVLGVTSLWSILSRVT